MRPELAVVRHDPPQDRLAQLRAEMAALGCQQRADLAAAMHATAALAHAVSDGADLHPPGIRDVARRLADDLEARVATIDAIIARTK